VHSESVVDEYQSQDNQQTIYENSRTRKTKKQKKTNLVKKEVVLQSGAIFIGLTTKGSITGTGRLVFPDDSVYEGEIKKGMPHGNG
jgi:hypothetical protein